MEKSYAVQSRNRWQRGLLITAIFSLIAGIVILILISLSGVSNAPGLNKLYLLQVNTSSLPFFDQPLTRWTMTNTCGVSGNVNVDCGNSEFAHPLSPVDNFRNDSSGGYEDSLSTYYFRNSVDNATDEQLPGGLRKDRGLLYNFSKSGAYLITIGPSVNVWGGIQLLIMRLLVHFQPELDRNLRLQSTWNDIAIVCLVVGVVLLIVGAAFLIAASVIAANDFKEAGLVAEIGLPFFALLWVVVFLFMFCTIIVASLYLINIIRTRRINQNRDLEAGSRRRINQIRYLEAA